MSLSWDIKLDGVSIADQISSFQIRETRGAYAREITLFAADPAFYDQFVYGTIPALRIEALTKTGDNWISQGNFYVEKPVIVTNPDSILSPGVWGRSESAAAGPPFAQKISKAWTEDTTCEDIVNEMAALCGLSVSFEITNYSIFANTYACTGIYPIDVIAELAGFAGAHIGCTVSGDITIKYEVFHPAAADYIITDTDIISITEQIEFPEFGNRIRISALGTGAGYQIDLNALADDDCLPADGTSRGTLLAFVTDQNGEIVPDNTIVAWTADTGLTLDEECTGTGNYLLSNQKHRASNYYTVSVDYPISDVIGIWAYADGGNNHNYWDKYCTFAGKTITVYQPFDFCDQSLRISYVTGGCAVNRVTAGNTARDIDVTAEVEGASDTIKVKLGNTCDCGSNLNVKVNPYGAICIGNLAHVLVWATINNKPATGKRVQIRIIEGCGQLSSENKTLDKVEILNETSYVFNQVSGVSQVNTEIEPASYGTPKVYLATDTNKSNNLYASHDGKTIDLNTIIETGTKVSIDHFGDGATIVAWRTLGVTKDCNAKIAVTMSDGTEAGLRVTASLSARDCSVPDTPPDHDDDYSEWDPIDDDWDVGGGGGGFPDDDNDADAGEGEGGDGEGEAGLACDGDILNSLLHPDDDSYRWGASSTADCPDEGEDFPCDCSTMCEAEISAHGKTRDYAQTIHEMTVEQGYVKGTPSYNEAYEVNRQTQMAICEGVCEDAREAMCGCDYVSGPAVLAPGETGEFVCSDGASVLFTMPEDACGTQTVTVGCCTFEVRSTLGKWVDYPVSAHSESYCSKGHNCSYSDEYIPGQAGIKCSGECVCVGNTVCDNPDSACVWIEPGGHGSCFVECGYICGEQRQLKRRSAICQEWVCE